MKYINPFKFYNISKICRKYGIKYYTINKDGSIDVNGNVDFSSKGLVKLPLKFKNVSGYFNCTHNDLISLEGSPEYVRDFNCSYNSLKSLKNSPRSVSGYFACSGNKLTTLKGSPSNIGGELICYTNDINTFEYFPKHVGSFLHCDFNPIYHIWRLFGDYSKIELFNDMDIIQDGVVILDRLNFFLEEIGRPTVKSVYGYKYI